MTNRSRAAPATTKKSNIKLRTPLPLNKTHGVQSTAIVYTVYRGDTSFHIHLQKSKNQGMTYIHLTATWLYGHIGRPDAAQVGRRHLCDAALELTRHQLEEVATP
jgi:hypothetical protein